MLEDEKRYIVFKHKHKDEYGQWMLYSAKTHYWCWAVSEKPIIKYEACYEGITAFRLSMEVGPQSYFGQEKSLEIGKDYILEEYKS